MNKDVSRLLVIGLVALVVWFVLNSPQAKSLIKNYGNVTLGGYENESVNSEGEELVTPLNANKHLNTDIPKVMKHEQISDVKASSEEQAVLNTNSNVLPYPQLSNNYAPQGNFTPSHQVNFAQLDCFPKDQLTSADLLPREDAYNIWNQSNPPVQGHLSNKNYVESGHHYGMNTVGQSLKNGNRQVRSDPLIPMKTVGPWQQSTIEADTNRPPFSIPSY